MNEVSRREYTAEEKGKNKGNSAQEKKNVMWVIRYTRENKHPTQSANPSVVFYHESGLVTNFAIARYHCIRLTKKAARADHKKKIL